MGMAGYDGDCVTWGTLNDVSVVVGSLGLTVVVLGVCSPLFDVAVLDPAFGAGDIVATLGVTVV